MPAPPDGDYEQSPHDWATSGLFLSAEEDSLVAVLEVPVCRAFVHGRDGYRQVFADLRSQFPQLTERGVPPGAGGEGRDERRVMFAREPAAPSAATRPAGPAPTTAVVLKSRRVPGAGAASERTVAAGCSTRLR
ncbi:hypothetical protein GCM10010172_66930 [Paractinoplanes ferrugineus]|uniref:Uncharacterized protein n=1 Tax=Paractinoplanes ferrugineus TaxID=113564 RepID=A0A919J9N1_9ACTN|nr:hypothetical protein [Actinoplanes ferrugineus]GIE13146.1 hypothetical protein Afe05nite_49860 [Actinoplanes ferrugineus]